MNRKLVSLCALGTIALAPQMHAQGTKSTPAVESWNTVDSILGRKGAAQPGDVMRYGFPRSDLTVTVRGVQLKPAFALGTWVAFKRIRGAVMAMGDLVLTEDEVEPVMLALQKGGVDQTALHNHLPGESPRVMYMHIRAHGSAPAIARTIRDALSTTHTPPAR